MSSRRGFSCGEAGECRLGLLRASLCALVGLGLLALYPATGGAVAKASAPVFEWLLLDADTGQVLSEQNADVLTYPASLTKMMTLYLTFEALNQGRIRLDTPFSVSEHAATRAPSKLALEPGDSITVHDLILGIVTKSANDAATVLAEGLAGSEANFARYMTWKARQLGMQHTWYQNASGLPNPDQRTTARDVARLALALYHQFPREYRYFSTQEFDFRGHIIHSHNHLMEWYPGLDGLKTGFINASGFNLAASAVRGGHRLIGVIMGGRSARSRDIEMASLLDQGFAVVNSRQPPAASAEPLVASATPPAPAPIPTPVPAPIPAAKPAVASASALTRTAAATQPARDEARDGFLSNVAKHLAPMAKAEAAPLPDAAAASAGAGWAIQLGAFRAEGAAERAAKRVPALAVLKGKPPQILRPAKSDRSRLYRARLLHFTSKAAQTACEELHRRGIACSIVRPGTSLASG
ncbi:MAG: D-alanyl-D-alanine carboxypeptidase family protein [Thiohalocapsa sp.]